MVIRLTNGTKHTIMKTEIKYYKGDIDCFGNHITEDRYIIADDSNMDIYGEHFDLETANDLIQ